MARNEQIMVRVTEGRKEEWKEEAERRGFRGLSGFIRFAVENEIDGREKQADRTDPVAEEIAEAIGEIDERTDGVQERLTAIETALTSLREEVSGEDSTVAPDLVTEHLPSMPPYEKVEKDGRPKDVMKADEEIREGSKTPETVAAEIGVPTEPVRRTLENLDLKSETVHSIEYPNGTRGYFVHV